MRTTARVLGVVDDRARLACEAQVQCGACQGGRGCALRWFGGGPRGLEVVAPAAADPGDPLVRVEGFIDRMDLALAITDLAVARAGSGTVSELAFARRATIEPHTNPNTTWFVVIEGGGWVQVGEERARVAAGEAVLWPADVVHGAWTDHVEMRAIVRVSLTVFARRELSVAVTVTTVVSLCT